MSALQLFDASLKPHYTEYIYALRNPENFDVFYVGRTRNPSLRLSAHISEAGSNSAAGQKKKAIIKSIYDLGKKPIMSIIDKTDVRITIDKYLSSYKEIKWMQFYKEIGWNLANYNAINRDLSVTDYMHYKRLITSREKAPSIDYYFYDTINGVPIYDLLKLNADGYRLPQKEPVKEHIPEPQKSRYNPWDNPRFRKMLDLDNKSNEYWYRDTDPNYYDDDY